jgi:UDP-3-O-[3-hydroxymyristoyl] glucosamine N-acyltransferase
VVVGEGTVVLGSTMVGASVVVGGAVVITSTVVGGAAVVCGRVLGGADDTTVASSSSDEHAPAVTIRPVAASAIATRPRRWTRVLELQVVNMRRIVR